MSEKFTGIGVSEGYAYAKTFLLKELSHPDAEMTAKAPETERARLENALDLFGKLLKKQIESADGVAGEILGTHEMLLSDPELKSGLEREISAGAGAEAAIRNVFAAYISLFESASDDRTRSRAQDLKETEDEILLLLSGENAFSDTLPETSVVIAREIPASFLTINRQKIAGIVSESGGVNAHAAIICRSLGIPAVFGVRDVRSKVKGGTSVLLDGFSGEVVFDPSDAEIAAFSRKNDDFLLEKAEERAYIGKKTRTKDGVSLELSANAGSAVEVSDAIGYGAEGIGLFRSEFLFLSENSAPTEEKQTRIYRDILDLCAGKSVTFRTLDVGGDKHIPYLDLPRSDNPFLGLRGVRYTLKNRDLFKTQLKALLRAGAGQNGLRILLPMVCVPFEIEDVQRLLKECGRELDEKEIPYALSYRLGVMIETPAAVFCADALAKSADFFSIGTNDLIQYVMAAERTDEKVSYLYSSREPAVLRAIKAVADAAKRANISVSVCGEAAYDPSLLPFFIGIGIDKLSVSGRLVPSVRRRIAGIETDACRKLSLRLLAASDAHEVAEILAENDKNL